MKGSFFNEEVESGWSFFHNNLVQMGKVVSKNFTMKGIPIHRRTKQQHKHWIYEYFNRKKASCSVYFSSTAENSES